MVENRPEREESPNKWNAATFGFAKDFVVSAAISGIIRTANYFCFKELTTVHSINDWWKQGRWKLDGVIALMFGAFGAFEEYNRATKEQKRHSETEIAGQKLKELQHENTVLKQMLRQEMELTKEHPAIRIEAASGQAEALLATHSVNQVR